MLVSSGLAYFPFGRPRPFADHEFGTQVAVALRHLVGAALTLRGASLRSFAGRC